MRVILAAWIGQEICAVTKFFCSQKKNENKMHLVKPAEIRVYLKIFYLFTRAKGRERERAKCNYLHK